MIPKLTFAFREFVPLYTAFIIDYSPNNYIIITKGKDTVCYLLGNLDKIEQIKTKLLKKDFRKKLIIDCINANKKLSNYNFKSNLSELSLEELQLEFKSIVKSALEWVNVYLLTEAEYWKGLERIITKNEKKQLSHLRFNAKREYIKYYDYVANGIFKNIIKKTKMNSSDMLVYTNKDILMLPKTQNKNTINNRKQCWGIIKKGKARRLMTNKELLFYNKIIKQELILKKKELNGTSVYKGLVVGNVKIVKVSSLKKIKNLDLKGKILVTPMTQPEIVPFLKGCLGIITDEGGLLCHASIVAREFKIPCIVGTKNATKILKDNNKVELDANLGKIKLL